MTRAEALQKGYSAETIRDYNLIIIRQMRKAFEADQYTRCARLAKRFVL